MEGLGSVSVICSDKTGTLTQNKMTVEYYYADGSVIPADSVDVRNPVHKQMLRYTILCNDSTNTGGAEIGDPTETALINLGDKLGVPAERVRMAYPRLSEIPFDSDRKLMSTFHHLKDGYTMVTKGAVDVLMKRTAKIQRDDRIRDLTEEDVREIEEQNRSFSEQGLRVLGVAYKRYDSRKDISEQDERDFIFLGLWR